MKLCCIEAEYEYDDPFDRQTVRPMLEILEAQRVAQFSLRDAITDGELLHLVSRWSSAEAFRGFRYLYFAGHGEKDELWFEEDRKTSISDVADRIAGCPSAAQRVVHFGACSVLANDQAATAFMSRSGIGAIYGYAMPVEWIDSAALDLLLMQTTARCFSSGNTLRRTTHRTEMEALLNEQAGLATRLGLRIWLRTGRSVKRLGVAETG